MLPAVQTLIFTSKGFFWDEKYFRASLVFLNYDIEPKKVEETIKTDQNLNPRKGLINFSIEISVPKSNRTLTWRFSLDYDHEGVYDNICLNTSLKISTVVPSQSDSITSISELANVRQNDEIQKTIFNINTSLPILSLFVIIALILSTISFRFTLDIKIITYV